jgi:hypothetical protein
MKRSLLSLPLVLLAVAACTDRDAPRPVPVPERDPAAEAPRPLSSHEAAAAPAALPAGSSAAVDPDDPAEPGISDLARLARYVFKTMQRHEEICPFENPFRDRLHVALAIEVRSGRIAQVRLGHVGLEPEAGGEARTLAGKQVPPELTTYVTCLGPHLQAVAMAPAPADGSYEPVYTFSGQPAGRAAP